MLAALGAVIAIVNGGAGKADIWGVNADDEYHEERSDSLEAETATGFAS